MTDAPTPPPVSRPRKRTLTVLAGGMLLLDGILMLIAGWFTRSWILAALGIGFFVLAGGTIAYYFRYQRALADVERARDALKAEAALLRQLIQERHEREGTGPQ